MARPHTQGAAWHYRHHLLGLAHRSGVLRLLPLISGVPRFQDLANGHLRPLALLNLRFAQVALAGSRRAGDPG
jgi:hypothetical protein